MLDNSNSLLHQAVLPYTFTTAELDSLKNKLSQAEAHIAQLSVQGKTPHSAVVCMSASEVNTLLKMIDMTYMQGLSAGEYFGTSTLNNSFGTNNGIDFSTVGSLNQMNGLKSMSNGIPKGNYICRKCGIPGHYIQNCPNSSNGMSMENNLGMTNGGSNGNNIIGNGIVGGIGNGSSSNKPPPEDYVCHKCKIKGHWIQHCPMGVDRQTQDYSKAPPRDYLCHRCNQPGHWIKMCPTNGNPVFDKLGLTNINMGSIPNNNITFTSLGMPSNIGGVPTSSIQRLDNGEPPSKKRRMV